MLISLQLNILVFEIIEISHVPFLQEESLQVLLFSVANGVNLLKHNVVLENKTINILETFFAVISEKTTMNLRHCFSMGDNQRKLFRTKEKS